MKVTSEKGMGGAFENLISRECRDLLKIGDVDVSKNWEAPKISVGSHARTHVSKPDFSGFTISSELATPGTHIVFEAKSTDEASLPLSNIRKHQWEHLQRANTAGAIAFLYVLKERDESKWIFPIWYIEEMRELRGSLPFEYEHFRKVKGETWVNTVVRLMNRGEWVF